MSAPDPDFEQLLSSFLDGAVSEEERALVEHRLANDPHAAEELKELRELQRTILAADFAGEVSLPPQFADRVVESAIDRARLEGHPEDHPLLRSATQPLGQTAPSRDRRWRVVVGAGLAVAASTLLVISLVNPSTETDDPASLIAMAEDGNPTVLDNTAENAETAEVPETLEMVAESSSTPTEDLNQTGTDASVEVQPSRQDSDLVDLKPLPKLAEDTTSAVATNQGNSVTGTPTMETTKTVDSAAEALMDSQPGAQSVNNALASNQPDPQPRSGPQAVLVLEVRLAESVFGLDPIQRAMDLARLDSSRQQPLNQSIVTAISSAVEGDGPSGSLMYLRAPGKEIDRFVLALISNPDEIAGVGFGLSSEPVVLESMGRFEDVDVTQIRHDFATVLTLDRIQRLNGQLRQEVFVPMDSSSAAAMLQTGDPSPDSGPDQVSHVFVLVRR